MAAQKTIPSLSEQIEKALDGRTQRSVVNKMREAGIEINEVQFSNKKSADSTEKFTPEELKVLSKILCVKIKVE